MAPSEDTFTERQQSIAQALISQMRALKEENNELRRGRDALAADKDNQAEENKTLMKDIEVLRAHKDENDKLQEKISKLEIALDDTQKLWKQSLEGIAQGLGIEVSTLLPEPEPDSPVSEPSSPVESIISEVALPGLEILEGLGCDKFGKIRNIEGMLVGKVDVPAGKKKTISTCYRRKLVCNRNGEFLENGVVVTRARLVAAEMANSDGWGDALPLEPSSLVVF
ncbi:hypothetical protein BLS_000930 [Venturia inaequalis]|uniref:Uncharacterized protein n=1 Tax=Venturia inaequalis TaxID=5025 RepID=A0A8H3UU12_VENIN|nr:hypothetical protein BLS_000930 [Venturia inaequalis]KAE9976621.1 hypothetical protein EG327_007987 [Venturia inaequalis]RDI81531.1 hypothetical protein Vi05172_g8474 [Venturia inaequalis]